MRNLPKEILFYPIPELVTASILDRFLYLAHLKCSWFTADWVRKRVAKVAEHDFFRLFGDVKINHLIHYTGFGSRYAQLMKSTPSEVNRVMFVHTDMMKEHRAKKNFNLPLTFSAYESVEKVAVVHENLQAGLLEQLPSLENKLFVVNNFLGEERIRKLAQEDLTNTLAQVKLDFAIKGKDQLLGDLLDTSVKVFINIGRYDYQKGHDRLIEAFENIYAHNQNTRLVIVAPHGPLRDQTIQLANNSSARNGIFILGRMGNPYPLLKACDAFVLSSHYEGLGLVVYEALAVGTAVVTVNLTETVQYLQNNEAIIVENSRVGLVQGMSRFLAEGIVVNTFDFSVAKARSVKEFEEIFK